MGEAKMTGLVNPRRRAVWPPMTQHGVGNVKPPSQVGDSMSIEADDSGDSAHVSLA